MLYTPGINNWNGFDSIQLRVVSAKAEQPRDIDAYIEKGMRYFCNGLLENLSYRLSEPEQLPEICETTLAELCSRSISGLLVLVFSAVKSAMLTFATLALRIHPFAATPFCLHRSLQICLHSGSARSFSTTIPLAAVFTRRFHAE